MLSDDEILDRIEESGLLPSEESFITLPEPLADHLREKMRRESPSSISPFLDCPFNWYVQRHAPFRSEVTEEEEVPWPIAGDYLHRVYQVFYDEPKTMRSEELLERILDHAANVLKSKDEEDGILSPETINRYYKMLESPKKDFFKKVFWEIVACAPNILDFDEDPSAIEMIQSERYISHHINGIRIGGKIDRVIRDAVTGDEIVEDYKSGRAPDAREKIDILTPRYLQPAIYAWLRVHTSMRTSLVPSTVIAVRLLFVRHLKRFNINITDETMQIIEKVLDIITKRMNVYVEEGVIPSGIERKGHAKECPACSLVTSDFDDDDTIHADELLRFVDTDKLPLDEKLLQEVNG